MSKGTILMVVDDDSLAIRLQTALTTLGYSVLKPVASGDEAIELAGRLQPDLILLDIEPAGEMNGIDIAEEIRISTGIPVIFLAVSPRHVSETAPYDVLTIPATGDELKAVIESALSRSAVDCKLKESEGRFHKLLESMTSGFALHEIILDANGEPCDYRFLEVNSAFERLTGLKAENVIGQSIEEVLPGKGRPWIETFGRVALTGETLRVENYVEDLGKYYEVTVYSPKHGQFAVIFKDITDHKRIEETLRESEGSIRAKLKAILEPESDLGALELEDILDISAIQSMMDLFYKLTAMPLAMVDIKGKVLIATGWQDVCTKFHRINPETNKKCLESDTVLTQGIEPGTCKFYLCKNGLCDYATPLMIAGKHMGNIFTGQFFFEDTPPDYNRFRAQAHEYGFDEEEYLAAVRRVPIWKRETAGVAMEFFARLAHMISDLSHGNLQLARAFTERDGLVNSLRRSEEKYRAVVENAREIIMVIQEGQIVFVNQTATDILGYSIEEITSESLAKFIHPADRELVLGRYLARMDGKPVTGQYTFRALHKNGEALWLDVNVVYIEWEGKPATLNFLTDITERRQAEEALRESEKSYRNLFDDHAAVKLVIDPATGNIIKANHAAAAYYGWSREQLAQMKIQDINIMPPEIIQDEMKNASSAQRIHFEFRHRLADGSIRDVEVFSSMIKMEGRDYLHSIVHDITERKLAEENLSTALQHLNAHMDNSPLAVIEFDPMFRVIRWSKEAERVFGWTAEEVEGKAINELRWVYNEDDVLVQQESSGLFSGERRRSKNVNRNYRKDGSIIWCEWYDSAIYDTQGNIVSILSLVLDITERKQAEEALRESEEKYRKLFDTTPVGTGISTLEGKVLTMNRSMQEITGYTEDEYRGAVLNTYANPEDREHVMEILRTQGRVRDMEVELVRRDGTHYDSLVNLDQVNMGGETVLVTTVRDITKRKQAEKALRESEETLRSVFKATPIGVTFNKGRRLISVNDSMCEIIGYTERELIGTDARIFFFTQEEYEEVGRTLYPQAIKDGRGSVETRMRRKDGSAVHVILTAGILHADNPSHGFVVTVNDITDRKKAEEALYESEKKFAQLVEQSPIAIEVYNSDGLLLNVNRAYENLWNIRKETVIGKFNILKHQIPRNQNVFDYIERAFRGEKLQLPLSEHDPNITGDFPAARKRFVQPYIYPIINERGVISHVVLINIDVTEQERLEQQLLQAQKMETIGRLAGGVAHDFNNILTVINANAEMALMFMEQTDQHYEAFEEIRKSGERAANLTRQLLAFSRRQIIEPRVINLNQTLMEMDKMFRRLIGEHIELITLPEESVWQVKVDPGQIEQVLINLVVNARDAMPDGGKLIIETHNVVLDEEFTNSHQDTIPGNYVMFAVSDTGIGMNAETLSHLFEPFFTTKPKGSGTGLGLSTCYGIVKQNKGGIWIYSEPARGTSVKVYLPAIEETTQNMEVHTIQEIFPPGTETVLVVEDDRGIRTMINRQLTTSGYRVLTASNGDEALSLVGKHPEPIQLLITDVIMPLMGGKELADRLAVIYPGLRILFMSGYTDNSIVHHGVIEPGIKFIQKPFSMVDFMRKIREVLGD